MLEDVKNLAIKDEPGFWESTAILEGNGRGEAAGLCAEAAR